MVRNKWLLLSLCLVMLLSVSSSWAAMDFEYDTPFVKGCTYNHYIPTPEKILGFPVGAQAATYQEMLNYFEALSESCEHVQLFQYGETHEGRKLIYLVVSSPENIRQLEAIKSKIRKLANPQDVVDKAELESIIETTPAIGWLGYSIHGDELSSTDAAIWVAYQLAAGQDEVTKQIRKETVVFIDPLQNPDGRERFLTQMRMFNGKVMNPDVQSANHAGMWPWGRGNHYLFDLNRDFVIFSQPETRARVKVWREYNPQLFVDSHEMSGLDTYLFSPSREPINPFLPPTLQKWAKVFAQDQASAFDKHGWSYYSREWLSNWYPGYTDWISYNGAIFVLYEQAGVDGSALKRHDGSAMTYRESVHHHITSSLANLQTLAQRRKEILTDYADIKLNNIQPCGKDEVSAYIIEPGKNASRDARFIEHLQLQGIEVYKTTKSLKLAQVRSRFGEVISDKEFPAGSCIVYTRQQMKNLIDAIMEFDPRMTDEFLKQERFYLEKKNQSRLYDVSSWSMPIAHAVQCYSATMPVEIESVKQSQLNIRIFNLIDVPAYGYVLDGDDDATTHAVSQLLDKGIAIRAGEKAFSAAGRDFSRGSFLIRKVENHDNAHETIKRIASKNKVNVYSADTALDLDKVDLGGRNFGLLTCPRIAIAMGRSISTTSYGALWNLLDAKYQIRASSLDANRLASVDLRKYNVLILPSGSYKESALSSLKQWVNNGGTLIALGGAVSYFTNEKTGMSAVRERKDVLDKLEEYEEAVEHEENALTATASQKDVWDYSAEEIKEVTPAEKKKTPSKEKLKRLDSWERRFGSHGTFLKTKIDAYHWLTYGVNDPLAVMVGSSNSYFAKPPVDTPVRFTDQDSIRVSGLLWPEARRRYAKTAYLTRERMGKGQLILFPFEPASRGYYPETTRMLWNAIFLGPGLGARTPIPW